MGKTVQSYRIALEDEISSWSSFSKHLSSKEDIEAFEKMMDASRNHASAGGNAVRPVVFEAMAMPVLLFHQKKLDKLEKDLEKLRSGSQIT